MHPHAGIHRGGNATRPRVRITARAERRGAANETTVKGTSEHGTHFFAEVRTSASSSPGARFFTQDSTCVIANAGDERCLQCSPTSRSPASPVGIGGSPGTTRKGIRRGHDGGRRSWPGARASSHPEHRLSGGEPTPSRRRVGDDAPTELTSAAPNPKGGGEACRGPDGANGDAPSSGRAHGFESMQDARGAGDWADLARPTVSPRTSSSIELERADRCRWVRIRVQKVRGNRRSHVDREVTRLEPDTRDERAHAVRAPVARASRASEQGSG